MPPTLTREDAARIAALAKVELSAEELDRVALQLHAMLSHFEQIASVDTAGVEPYIAAHSGAAPLREDTPAPSLDTAGAFDNAPDAGAGSSLFRVPRVLSGS